MTYATEQNALSNEQEDFVVQAYRLGYNQIDIAKSLNVCLQTVRRAFTKRHITCADKGSDMTPLSELYAELMEGQDV